MSITAVSATALPVEADAELVNASCDLAAIDQVFEDLYRKHGRDAYSSPLGVRRNENIATLITIQAKSAAGIHAKAASLQLRAMIADQDQHQQIAVSLADDLVGGIPLAALAAAAPAHAAAAVDPIYVVIEAHRKACTEHNEAIHIHMAFEEVGMTGEKLEKYESLVAETDAAYDRLDDVGCDLINTKPTTFAGILALCRYVKPFFGESDSDELPHHIL
jgi:hypothetical protein